MPHEQMNIKQVAAYLHLDIREVTKRASRGQMPCRKVRGEFIFRKGDLDHWIESQMHGMERSRLAGIEKGVSAHHGFDATELLITPMVPADGLAAPLQAKTGPAAIRALVSLAEQADLVYVRDELIGEIAKREELCSTAMLPGVAIPHPRHPLPYDIAESFVVAGLVERGIPFGSPDGGRTRLFFLVCCKDETTHLHVLARLAQMLHDPAAIETILAVEDSDEFMAALVKLESAQLKHNDPG